MNPDTPATLEPLRTDPKHKLLPPSLSLFKDPLTKAQPPDLLNLHHGLTHLETYLTDRIRLLQSNAYVVDEWLHAQKQQPAQSPAQWAALAGPTPPPKGPLVEDWMSDAASMASESVMEPSLKKRKSGAAGLPAPLDPPNGWDSDSVRGRASRDALPSGSGTERDPRAVGSKKDAPKPSKRGHARRKKRPDSPTLSDDSRDSDSYADASSLAGRDAFRGDGYRGMNRPDPNLVYDGDFSRVKVATQIPLQNFLTFFEQYTRPLTDDDLQWLVEQGPHAPETAAAFAVPPLGRPYREVWQMEDAGGAGGGSDRGSAAGPKEPNYFLRQNVVVPGSVGFGSLTERLLCAFLPAREPAAEWLVRPNPRPDHLPPDELSGSSSVGTPQETSGSAPGREKSGFPMRPKEELQSLEARLRAELAAVGLLDDDGDDDDGGTDDDILRELRRAQSLLRAQLQINRQRKQVLLKVARPHLAYQEYASVRDEIERQIDNAYAKSVGGKRGKRKRRGPSKRVVENLLTLMNKRKRLIREVGGLFPDDKFGLPRQDRFTPREMENPDMPAPLF